MHQLTEEKLARVTAESWKEDFGVWPSASDLIIKLFADDFVDYYKDCDQNEDDQLYAMIDQKLGATVEQFTEKAPNSRLRYQRYRLVGQASFAGEYDDVTELGHFLVHELSFDEIALQAYYEKPWQWGSEFAAFQLLSKAGVQPA